MQATSLKLGRMVWGGGSIFLISKLELLTSLVCVGSDGRLQVLSTPVTLWTAALMKNVTGISPVQEQKPVFSFSAMFQI